MVNVCKSKTSICKCMCAEGIFITSPSIPRLQPAMMIPPMKDFVALQTQQQLGLQQMVHLDNQIAFQRQQQEQMIFIQQHNPGGCGFFNGYLVLACYLRHIPGVCK